MLTLEAGTGGMPTRGVLLRSGGSGDLDRLAREAAKGWKFVPPPAAASRSPGRARCR